MNFAPFAFENGYISLIPVIQSGLTIYVDASIASSYPGTGSTWTNLITATGHNGSISNFTYQSGVGGFLTSTGSTTGQISFGYPTSAAAGTGFTFGGWFSPYFTGTTGTTFMRFVDLDSSTTYSNGLYLGTTSLGKGKAGGDLIVSSGSGYNTDTNTNSSPILLSGTWYYLNYVWTSSSQYQIYVNGSLAVTRTSIGSGLRINSAGFNIGQNSGTYWKESVSTFEFYNRALSGSEILSNYNATKTRFGY